MSLKDVKKGLENLNKKDLTALIIRLYQSNKSVQEYLEFQFHPNEDEILKKYKEKVLEAFYPKRGYQLRLKLGKQAISDFKKIKPSPESIIDLLLYYVENGVQFTLDYGDIDERFYYSLESVYSEAIGLIEKNDVYKMFEDRAYEVVEKTKDIGWGFHDFLADTYLQAYSE